ncbi:Gfo/Idh/MocA family oxidoreductase [Lentisphaerota bacterium ZTH]|nr:Gfo/Idh/MocA family oxidoreductase [Lentisphaerota bacterium]WET06770.1 Gfo/Idh/MocA family oxidoreductase [Lentisphaerota bacterium ZTH]
MHDFRFVIIGTGNIARTYLSAIDNLKSIGTAGFISRRLVRPDGAPETLPAAASLQDFPDEFDGIIIATPNGLHHKWAIAAAEMGKHVLTEKPLDISTDAMSEMISACHTANVKLGCAYQYRTNVDNMIVKELIDQNAFGRIIAADYRIKCWRDQAYYDSAPYRGGYAIDGGGPFIQQACHQVDIYGWFFGRPVKTISMLGNFMHNMEAEDHGVAVLQHENGMIGTIEASTCAFPGFEPELQIHTEKGSIVLTNGIITGWHIKNMPNPSREASRKMHSGAGSAAVEETSGHERIIEDFVDAVRSNRQPIVSGEEARLATEIVLDIYNNNVYKS